jgi:hypothetical protein
MDGNADTRLNSIEVKTPDHKGRKPSKGPTTHLFEAAPNDVLKHLI